MNHIMLILAITFWLFLVLYLGRRAMASVRAARAQKEADRQMYIRAGVAAQERAMNALRDTKWGS